MLQALGVKTGKAVFGINAWVQFLDRGYKTHNVMEALHDTMNRCTWSALEWPGSLNWAIHFCP